MNRLGANLVRGLIDSAERLNVAVEEYDSGATVVDCGVNVHGGYDAGRVMAEVCMGGLASTRITMGEIDGIPIPYINVETDHPAVALLGSQKAGWSVAGDDYFGMGSGPARALALKPKKTYEKIGYEDEADEAVIVLESDVLPPEEVLTDVAEACGVSPDSLYALVAPTSSMAGSVQVAARIVETSVYRLNELGYDTTKIVSGAGTAPLPPVNPDSTKAMGITNDAQIYYGSAYLTVEEEDILEYVEDVPSENSSDYGAPFFQTFKEAGYDFYEIDQSIFAPAEVTVNVLETGDVVHEGSLNLDVVKESFGI